MLITAGMLFYKVKTYMTKKYYYCIKFVLLKNSVTSFINNFKFENFHFYLCDN